MVIRPRGPYWRKVPREVVDARFLFWNMTRAAAKAPYAGTYLGPVWTMLRPLVFLAVIMLLKRWSGARVDEYIPYALYLYSGLILWWYFVDATKQASKSIFQYRGLITKIYYPRIITPAVPVFARVADLLVQLIPLVVLMVYFGEGPGAGLALAPLVIANMILLCLGLGYLFSALSAVVVDVERLLDYLLYVGLFLSPVLYSIRTVPSEYVEIFAFANPTVGPLLMWRSVLFDSVPPAYTLWGLSLFSTALIFVLGAWLFSRVESSMSERVL